MTGRIEKLEAALRAAFPAVSIDREMIDEPSGNWTLYDDRAELAMLEGKTWRDGIDVLVRHSTLPVYAGDALWRATLPGYLHYLLHERELFTDLPFQLARQLTRPADPDGRAKFDRRISPLSPVQRSVVRQVLGYLAHVRPMEDAMDRALTSWEAHEGVLLVTDDFVGNQ